MNPNLIKQLFGFVLVGGVGFLVDAVMLWSLQPLLPVAVARLLSFSFALCVTWLLNSRFTFRTETGNFYRYLISQSVGVVVNYTVFFAIIIVNGNERFIAIAALAVASAVAMLFNFVAMRFWVFKPR